MKWPEQVPVLEPEDFVIGPYECGSRFCLVGWTDRFFWMDGAYMAMDRAMDHHGCPLLYCFGEPNTLRNRRLAARVWATMLEDLGYTEDGPTVEM